MAREIQKQKSKLKLLFYVPFKGFTDHDLPTAQKDGNVEASSNADGVLQAVSIKQPCSTVKILNADYNLAVRCGEFLKRYPGLRGQYCLELVNFTPYLISDEKESVRSDYSAVFRALNWPEFAYSSRLDHLVPDSRTPFKDCIAFCWYAYCPYSQHGTRMRTLYQNVMFRDSATWFMTNKHAMLRRLLLFEQARRAAVEAGIFAHGEYDISCSSFMPLTLIYSRGKEASVAAGLDSHGTYIVKPAAGFQGRGIELYRCGGEAKEFGVFMRDCYGEQNILSSFYIIQRYVDRPLLIRGRKFDMRIYVLIVPNMTCCLGCDSNAARRGFYAFYHPGFARLSCLEYGDGSSSDRRVHLTNCSVQEFEAGSQHQQPEGNNWSPDQLNEYFNGRFDQGLDNIHFKDWFRTTVQADLQGIMAYVLTNFARLLVTDANNAFKLLGCDFLLDEGGRPWLLEMNSMPSMKASNACLKEVKTPMQREALALAIEVAHRSANGQPVNSRCLTMRQNFRLVYSATNPRVQGCLIRAFSDRLKAPLRSSVLIDLGK